jgi:hypothetical protein
VRSLRVLLGSDLAVLYSAMTKCLNEQVRRNAARFPPDFIPELSNQELAILRSQNATLRFGHGQRREYLTLAFTEHGAIMAATILQSGTELARRSGTRSPAPGTHESQPSTQGDDS